MTFLHTGRILEIDLSTHEIQTRSSKPYIERFIGARGINDMIMYENVKPGIDPLGEENLLIFGAGALTGTSCPASARTEVTAKSPVTGGLGTSNFGGKWSPHLKWAGYDNLVIRGKSEKPVYIVINNDKVDIRSAESLWGRDTYATQKKIKADMQDKDVEIVCIGPAGEKLVSSACLIHRLGNAAGRTGLGAVMGSKKLKAIAVKGTNKEIPLFDPALYRKIANTVTKDLSNEWFTKEFKEMGLARWEDFFGKKEFLASTNYRNYAWDSWDPEKKTSFTKLWTEKGNKKYGCYGCPAPCMENYKVKIDNGSETVISCCLYFISWATRLTDRQAMLDIAAKCQTNGIDVNSFINLTGWVMELFENSIITEDDIGGMQMKWGDKNSILKLMELIVNREGIGDILAENTDKAISILGNKAGEFMMHINGNPTFMLNHQAYKAVGLSAAVGTRSDVIRGIGMPDINKRCIQGYMEEDIDKAEVEPFLEYYTQLAQDISGFEGDHLIRPNVYEGKAKIVEYYEDIITISDLMGGCKFLGLWFDMPMTPEKFANMYEAGKGVSMSETDLIQNARKVMNLERAFNCREGRTRENDSLPKRFFERSATDGEFKGEKMNYSEFEKMKDEYYENRGWDKITGIPSKKTLKEYGLDDILEDLEMHNVL